MSTVIRILEYCLFKFSEKFNALNFPFIKIRIIDYIWSNMFFSESSFAFSHASSNTLNLKTLYPGHQDNYNKTFEQ